MGEEDIVQLIRRLEIDMNFLRRSEKGELLQIGWDIEDAAFALQRLTVGPGVPVERHYYAVDYTGVIHECEDEDRVIAAAKQFAETANQNSAAAFAAGVEAAARLVDETYLNPVIARAIRAIAAPSSPPDAEPSEAEVEAVSRVIRQALGHEHDSKIIIAGNRAAIRGMAEAALTAAANARASQQGGE